MKEKAKEYAHRIADNTSEVWHFMDEVYTELENAYLAGASETLTAQWRSVEDETPEEGEYVIIDGPNGIEAAVWNEHYQVWDDAEGDDFMYKKDAVKMWMSIPQPPVYARTT